MTDEVVLTVTYTENDFVRGMNYALKSERSDTLSTLIFLIAVVIGYPLIYTTFVQPFSVWTTDDYLKIALGIFFAGFVAYIMKDFSFSRDSAFEKVYSSTPVLRETYQISISQEGIFSSSDSFSSELKWTAVLKSGESDEDFHFFTGPGQSLFIPKHVMSIKQQNDVRVLTRRSLLNE